MGGVMYLLMASFTPHSHMLGLARMLLFLFLTANLILQMLYINCCYHLRHDDDYCLKHVVWSAYAHYNLNYVPRLLFIAVSCHLLPDDCPLIRSVSIQSLSIIL